jgi:cellulose biosynthesis protein BcsQ
LWPLSTWGLLLTKTIWNNVCREVETELRSRFGTLVFKTTVPSSTKFEDANARGLCLLDYAPKNTAAMSYFELVEGIVSHGKESNRHRKVQAVLESPPPRRAVGN